MPCFVTQRLIASGQSLAQLLFLLSSSLYEKKKSNALGGLVERSDDKVPAPRFPALHPGCAHSYQGCTVYVYASIRHGITACILLYLILVHPGTHGHELARKGHNTGYNPTVPVVNATESSYRLWCSSICHSPGWLPSLLLSRGTWIIYPGTAAVKLSGLIS